MAERMNCDLLFDHAEAARDFGIEPRAFVLAKHNEMSAFAPFSSDMKHPDICADVAAFFNADGGGAGGQLF